MPNPFSNQYHGNPQMGPDGVLRYPDGSFANPDGSIYNPSGETTVSPLGSGTAGMTSPTMESLANSTDPRFKGVYSNGGQVDPNRPPQSPFGSSNPERDRKQQELADRNEARGRHPMTERSVGTHILTNPNNPRVTYHKRITRDGRVSYYGRYEDPNAVGGYQEFNPYTSRVSNQGDGVIKGQDTYFARQVETGKKGAPKLDASGHQQVKGESDLYNSQAHVRDNYLGNANQGGTPAENTIRGASRPSARPPSEQMLANARGISKPSGTSPSSFSQETTARYPKMSASLNKPISEFGIEDGTEHLQNLYDKQRELMDVHGLNSQNNAGARAIRKRAMELQAHITKLEENAALKTPEQLTADGERPLPPRKPLQYTGALETDWQQGMHGFDKDGSGGLNQEELRAWRKWKQSGQANLQKPSNTKHGSSTHMTPPGQMPGYTLRGGFSSTGTQHQDTGGVNPNAPLFHGDGTMHNDPGLIAPNNPSVSGQDMMQQFPPGMPNPTPDARLETNYGVAPSSGMMPPASPAEQAGMVDSVTGPAGELSPTQQQGLNNIVKLIETGRRNFKGVMNDPKIPGMIKARIFQLDADGDGKLSKREIKNSDYIHQRMENATRPGSGEDRNGLLARIRANRQQRRGN